MAVGPAAQPNDKPAIANQNANDPTQQLLKELVRHMKNVQVDNEVLTWQRFVMLPIFDLVESMTPVPLKNLKISDRDAHVIANWLSLWPERNNVSNEGLCHLCIQIALMVFMIRYGWQRALKMLNNITEKQVVSGCVIA